MNPGAFAEIFSAVLPALQEAVELAGNPSAAQDDRLTAANAFAESLGDLWPAAEEHGPHIAELLAVIDGLVSGLPHRAAGSDAAGVAALEVLALLEAHLTEPHEQEIVAALLELANSEAFDPPLSPAATALWQERLNGADGAGPDSAGGLAPEETADRDDVAAPLTTATQAAADAGPDEPAATPAAADTRALSDDALERCCILAATVDDSCQDFLRRVADIAKATRAADRTAGAAAGRAMLDRCAEASAAIGFAAFAALCSDLGAQMGARSPKNPWPKSLIADLTRLPQRMLDYLAEPLAEAPCLALVATLSHPRWPSPLATDRAAELREALYRDARALAVEAAAVPPAGVQDEDRSSAPADESVDMDSVGADVCGEAVAEFGEPVAEGLGEHDEAVAELAAPPARQATAPIAGEAETPVLSDDALELLSILAAAVDDNGEDFLHRVAEIDRAPEADDRTASAAAAREILDRFAEASADVGFAAFGALCSGLGEQMGACAPKNPWPKSLIEDLTQLPQRMLDYLADPLAEAPRLALVAALAHPCWPEPLASDRAAELGQALYQDPLALEVETGPARATKVEDDDVSLSPADDMDFSVLASFRREGPDMAQRLASIVQVILRGGPIEDALRQAQRYAHTLKGSANVCGVRAVAVLGHHMEDLLEFLTEQELAPGPALGETLVAAADGLAAMFDVINGIEQHDPEAFRPIMQQVLDWANRIDREGIGALDWTGPATARTASAPATPAPSALLTSAAIPAAGTLSAALEPAAPPPGAGGQDADDAYLQVPARAIDNLLRLVGEMSLALSQSEERLRQAQRTLSEAEEIDLRNLLQVAELEKLVDLRGLGSRTPGGSATAPSFDPLELDQYDEMYIAARRLNEGVSDVRDLTHTMDATIAAMDELTQQQIKLSQELRQLTMGTRLVPVHSVVGRLQRAVRQTCRATGKEAELRVQGNEVLIDGDVLDQLMPALMHVVRNSIDHGIEPAGQRAAAGKPPQGELTIGFRQSGDQIEVSFGDDGAGLDLDRVKAKAVATGLLAPEASPTPQELLLLTLRPGFSTRQQVTQVSGRGVGMDVVANTVRALNGSLTLESESGVGYRLRARFPSSLATIYCLLIRSNDEPLALPANEVRFAVLADEGEIVQDADGWRFRHAEETYPLVHINTLIGRAARAPEAGGGVVLVVVSDSGDRAVMVDALIDGRELVVKKLGALIPPIPGLLAASILGDGRVVPIIELRAMMRIAASADLSAFATEDILEQTALPTVLIVDDSLSMRRVLAQLVTDAGYRALTARDGMDAIQTLTHGPVDVMLVDMEMPQMNGLELTAHLRAQPETSALPIAMITSRSTERHRNEALKVGVNRYFVKPYHDEEVLDFLQQALERAA